MYGKLKCVVIDDSPLAIEVIKELCEYSGSVELVGSFESPMEFIKSQGLLDYDFCFLDIYMPEMSGVEVAKHVRNKLIVFYTGEESILKTAINLSPVDILTKPVTIERFEHIIKKVKIILGNGDKKEYHLFNVAKSGEKLKVKLGSIVYVKTCTLNPRNKEIILNGGKRHILIDCTFNELLNLCPNLAQANRTELVSLEIVDNVRYDGVTLGDIENNGVFRQVSISDTCRKAFMERMRNI